MTAPFPREPDAREALADLPQPETMLAYANILEKPQYYVDAVTGKKYPLATGEIIEAASAALRVCASLRQPAAPGGDRELIAFELWQRFAPVHHIGWKDETHKAEYYAAADAVLAALPSPPPSDERVKVIEDFRSELRKYAIKPKATIQGGIPLVSGGRSIPGKCCDICKSSWVGDAVELHASTCPLSSTGAAAAEKGR